MQRRTFVRQAAVASTAALASAAGGDRDNGWKLPAALRVPENIWDVFYWGAWQERTTGLSLGDALQAERAANARAGLARQCVYLHVGNGTARPEYESHIRANPAEIRDALTRHADRLFGIAKISADDVPAALAAIDTWVANGPMVGICLVEGKLPCSHSNFDAVVQRAAELDALIFQLNWFDTREAGRNDVSTPATLATLAGRHPDVKFISGHAGGEWEKGLRALRAHPNVLVDTSGFDPTAGFIEMAVRELGSDRILFGSHSPSRSSGTELSKILSANLSAPDKALIFGGNLRRLLAPILKRKGLSTD